MIEFKKGNYFYQLWFVEGHNQDWLATIYKDETGKVHLVYRFRYYRGPDPFDDNDVKNWYAATSDDNSPEAIAKYTQIFDAIAKTISSVQGGGKLYAIPIHGDGEKAAALLAEQPWCHMKVALRPVPTDTN